MLADQGRWFPSAASAKTSAFYRLVERFYPQFEAAQEGKVLYKTEDNRLGRFPEAASNDWLAGPKRNFQIFDPLDFLAEVTQHPPSLC